MAVAAARRRADRDEDRLGAARRAAARSVVKAEPAGADVARDQSVEAGLEDRHFAALERRDLGFVLVDADHVVAEIGEAGAGPEPT